MAAKIKQSNKQILQCLGTILSKQKQTEERGQKHHRDANSKIKSETICRASVLQEKRKMGNGRKNYKLRGTSVQFSHSVVSNSLRPHEPQDTRPRCPSPTPESTQIHVDRVDDIIQPSHPLSSPSPPALNLSQHQGLFK